MNHNEIKNWVELAKIKGCEKGGVVMDEETVTKVLTLSYNAGIEKSLVVV